LKRATELEAKLQNPAFKAAFNRVKSTRKRWQHHSGYGSLQDDVRETNMAYHIGNPYDLSAVMPESLHTTQEHRSAQPAPSGNG
jgi:hypothetical protein